MLIDHELTQSNQSKGDGAGKSRPALFETLNAIWDLNHCYARIRIISAYCLFLLKRAKFYKLEINRRSTAEFVQEQFREMIKYKGQIVEIEMRAVEEANQTNGYLKEEIKRLSMKLKSDLDHRFRLVAEKVGEKIPGETTANRLTLAEEDVEVQLPDEYQLIRQW